MSTHTPAQLEELVAVLTRFRGYYDGG